MVDFLLYRVINKEAVYDYVSLLADSESSVSGLNINHWVPIGVKYDDLVGTLEVDAKASYLCGQEEDKNFVFIVKSVNDTLSLVNRHCSIHAEIIVVVVSAQPFKDIQNFLRLAEYKHLVRLFTWFHLAVLRGPVF